MNISHISISSSIAEVKKGLKIPFLCQWGENATTTALVEALGSPQGAALGAAVLGKPSVGFLG